MKKLKFAEIRKILSEKGYDVAKVPGGYKSQGRKFYTLSELREWAEKLPTKLYEERSAINSNMLDYFYEGLPDDYGSYFFELISGMIVQGYYSSFPYPYNNQVIRCANLEEQHFFYLSRSEIRGYYHDK